MIFVVMKLKLICINYANMQISISGFPFRDFLCISLFLFLCILLFLLFQVFLAEFISEVYEIIQ